MTISQTEPGVGFDDLRRTGPTSYSGPTGPRDTAVGTPLPRAPRRVDPTIPPSIRERALAQLAAAQGRGVEEPAPATIVPANDPPLVDDQLGSVVDGLNVPGATEQPDSGESTVVDELFSAEGVDQVGNDAETGSDPSEVPQTNPAADPGTSSAALDVADRAGGVPGRNQEFVRAYDDVDLSPAEVPLPTRATNGWRARLGLGPSQAEARDLALKRAMNVNFGQPVKIVLANPRGYAGKTSLTLGLAGALGRARAGGVCAFEDHELRGTMALRVMSNGTTRTIRNFINDLSSLTPDHVRHADLHRYLRHQDSGQFDAMVTSSQEEEQLTGDEFRAGLELLARFYQAIVVDTANNEAHEAFRAAIESATVLVVPIKWRRTHVRPAIQMLKDMSTRSPHHERLVRNAVVVASHADGELIADDRAEWLDFFTERAHAVIEIGTDPHISADRPIVHDQLTRATQISLDRLGAAVCAAAMTNINEKENV